MSTVIPFPAQARHPLPRVPVHDELREARIRKARKDSERKFRDRHGDDFDPRPAA